MPHHTSQLLSPKLLLLAARLKGECRVHGSSGAVVGRGVSAFRRLGHGHTPGRIDFAKMNRKWAKTPASKSARSQGQGPEAPLSVVMVVRLNFCAQLSANLYLFCKICVHGDIGPPARCCPALPAAILGNDDKIY